MYKLHRRTSYTGSAMPIGRRRNTVIAFACHSHRFLKAAAFSGSADSYGWIQDSLTSLVGCEVASRVSNGLSSKCNSIARHLSFDNCRGVVSQQFCQALIGTTHELSEISSCDLAART